MNPDLAVIVEALEAERLTPVPRASHVVGVEAQDLAVILGQVQPDMLHGDAAVAYHRLAAVIRGKRARAAVEPGSGL
jgi:hypothetical protein